MRVLLPLFAAIAVLAACSSRDLYRTGQGWQAEQCRRLQDPAERSRCEKSTARSYDDYRAETDKARSAPR
jgi:hypothetical protein